MKTSVMLESYCADIERRAREGALRTAVRLSVSLPDIGAALADPQMQGSRERYVNWCATWLNWQATRSGKPVSGERLHRLYTGRARMRHLPGPADDHTASALVRMRISRSARRERALALARVWQPASHLQAFQLNLIEALVDASRRWYREQGANNPIVQRNLGRLLISG